MKILFKNKKNTYYLEPLLDAVIDTSVTALLKNLNKDLLLWDYPKPVKITGDNTIYANYAKITIKTPSGNKIVKLKATFVNK